MEGETADVGTADEVYRVTYLTAQDIATELRVHLSTAYEWIRQMPYLKIGSTIRVSRKDFDRWLEEKTVSSNAGGSTGRGSAVSVSRVAARSRGDWPSSTRS